MNYNYETSRAFVNTKKIFPYREGGKLAKLTFAVKDNIDLAGQGTSYGSKPWLMSHPVAVTNAACVDMLLAEGATCVGKTISDELTCSLDGENYFYGTPKNAKAPDRIPGGSSSGSASAVACELVDFAVGTDCAGSVRVPASHCGVIGMRPSLHRISEAGVLPFAPSFSTVGVFTNKLKILEKVMQVLLANEQIKFPVINNIYLIEDAMAIADPEVRVAIENNLPKHKIKKIKISDILGQSTSLEYWLENVWEILEAIEIYNSVGPWIEAYKPELSPRVAHWISEFKTYDRTGLSLLYKERESFFQKVREFMQPGDLFCYPTVAMVAPKLKELDDTEKAQDYYHRIMAITLFAGLARLPEISLPVAHVDGAPLGLSLAAANGQDEFLIAAAQQLFATAKIPQPH